MKFTIGDNILIKKTKEEGFLTAFLEDGMVEVIIGKTKFPIDINEIDHPYLYWFTDKKKNIEVSKSKQQTIENKISSINESSNINDDVYLQFYSEYDVKSKEKSIHRFQVYLNNNTLYELAISYNNSIETSQFKGSKIIIKPSSKQLLNHIIWEELQQIPIFNFEIQTICDKRKFNLQKKFKIKAAKIFKNLTNIDNSDETYFTQVLIQDIENQQSEVKPIEKASVRKETKETLKPQIVSHPIQVLDLHIEAITNHYKSLNSNEILNLQLNELEYYLEIAFQHKQERMIIIHGNGSGVLRKEVEKILKNKKYVSKIDNGYQEGYGFGATLVLFSY